jgi:integrase/recombinase XerD
MRKYSFTDPEILLQLHKLTSFFQQKKFAPNTIKVYCNYVGYFLEWLKIHEIKPKSTTYNHLLQFINHCRGEGRKTRNINLVLTAVRHYFDMLQLNPNPASGLYIRGETKGIPNDLLTPEELEELYKKHEVFNERTQRNKVITGLYVYQGITTDELKKLTPKSIDLKAGKIHIPATKQTYNKGGRKSRTLKLKASQILELQEYLLVTRPKINTWKSHQLFVSLTGSENLKNSIKHLMEDLRKIDPQVNNGRQLRKSVIVNWLKEKDIRQVQYLAGHSSISSTERYRAANLEELEEALKVHHPLNYEVLTK